MNFSNHLNYETKIFYFTFIGCIHAAAVKPVGAV